MWGRKNTLNAVGVLKTTIRALKPTNPPKSGY